MSDEEARGGSRDQRRPLTATLLSLASLLRGLPLLFRPAPRTPLRVLCIVALDTVHRLRHSQPIPRHRIREIAAFLDFQASTNAAWDQKSLFGADYQAIREGLEKAGLGMRVEQYLIVLQEMERRRPSPGGDCSRFEEVRAYREAVAGMSLAAVAAIARNAPFLDDVLRATRGDR